MKQQSLCRKIHNKTTDLKLTISGTQGERINNMTNTAIILGYMQLNNLDPNKIVLHTYAQWKKLGYQVKKGEKSKHKITVWKRSTKKIENEDGDKEEVDNGRYFLKESAFFTQEQVERITNERNI